MLLLRSLMEHAASPADRTVLGRLCGREGAAEYLATLREPCPYSLASCPAGGSAATRSFLFTLVTAPRAGLATSWLASAAPGTAVPLYLRTGGAFVPPADLAESYVMVAAGSGLGPFLAFLQDRRARLGAAGSAPIGSCWLFFGCRSRSRDYIMQELLEEMLEAGVLSRLTVSFSREEGGGAKYVQDSMKEHEGEIIDLLTERGASLYVCGDAKGMARGVQAALEEMMVGVKGLEPEVAAHAVKDLRLNKKYLEDIWT
jgi:sulfite reductase alpha subunit-like flavoprotein